MKTIKQMDKNIRKTQSIKRLNSTSKKIKFPQIYKANNLKNKITIMLKKTKMLINKKIQMLLRMKNKSNPNNKINKLVMKGNSTPKISLLEPLQNQNKEK